MQVEEALKKQLKKVGVTGDIQFTAPPNSEMGDIAFTCFPLAKEWKKSPAEIAKVIASKISEQGSRIVERAVAVGPYVNFFISGPALAEMVLSDIQKAGKKYGTHATGKKKKILVEFAHPNTHKAFHIGHLRNIITGESIARLYENGGYIVKRVNYHGDIGMHIAKCLYGILANPKSEIPARNATHSVAGGLNPKSLEEKVALLGKAYAAGSQAFESDEKVKKEVEDMNEKIYRSDPSIRQLYQTTRKWSLQYFDAIYKRVGTKFDRLYFESEVFDRGREIVKKYLQKGIFKESAGAIIFEGSIRGLHDRVFINSKGFPTYEGKEMGLAELQLKEHHPHEIIHVTGKEQADYFKVVFKAIDELFPKICGKEKHIVYGWVDLKGGKMSSRLGNVVLGEELLDDVQQEIAEIMKDAAVKKKAEVIQRVGMAAVKYAFLKTSVANDISFDLKESVSTEGDSGPYLLYIVARIKSILKKSKVKSQKSKFGGIQIHPTEKALLLRIAQYPEVTEEAVEAHDPSKVAQYLFKLAQDFNHFYHECPVLKAEKEVSTFRVQLIRSVAHVMERGLYLLGVKTVDEM